MLVIYLNGDGNCFIDQLKPGCVNCIRAPIKEMEHSDLVIDDTKLSAMNYVVRLYELGFYHPNPHIWCFRLF
jgi:hypothetical protein